MNNLPLRLFTVLVLGLGILDSAMYLTQYFVKMCTVVIGGLKKSANIGSTKMSTLSMWSDLTGPVEGFF